MKKVSAIVIMIIIMTMLTGSTALAGHKAPRIKVTVNNKTVKYNVVPYLKDGEVMIPVKQTSEALGAKVEWDKKESTEWVNLDMMHIELPVGRSEFYIHRDADFSGIPQTVKLNTAIISVNGVIFVPGEKFIASLGATVSWNSKKNVLSITKTKSTGIDLTKTIPYTEITKNDIAKIKDVYKWYQHNYKKSGIRSMKKNGVIYVLLGAGSKPTEGYTVGINKITYDTESKAYIYGYVKRPTPDKSIPNKTYPNMLIKIEGCKNLKSIHGEMPEMIVDIVPPKASYEELTFDSIQDNSILNKWYNENAQKKGISYIRDGKYIYALIGAGEKPTGGYTLTIDNAFYSSYDTVTINARVTPPADNVRVMMVITYPSTLIRIESDLIKAVIGEVIDTTTSGKEKWITMDSSTVTKMELYNLDQVKLRDITGTEKDDIMKSFNEATINPNPYIKMIAGNVLKVTINDGYVLTFTSYGSDTNVIVNFEKDGEARTFHLTAPVIAKTLLS